MVFLSFIIMIIICYFYINIVYNKLSRSNPDWNQLSLNNFENLFNKDKISDKIIFKINTYSSMNRLIQ